MKDDVIKNKYLMCAYKKSLSNFRVMTVGDIVRNNWKPGVHIEKYVVKYIRKQGEVLLIANPILKYIPQIQIRAVNPDLKKNRFTVRGSQSSIPYGFGMLNDNFEYGDWIIMVEGVSDREALVDIYPNVIAVLTDGISLKQREVLKNLTDKFLIIYDNDEAGRKGFYRDRKILNNMNKTVRGFKYPGDGDIEDPGDILQLEYEGKSFEADIAKDYFENYINFVVRR
ncbi:MAG: toprim domain-containing protein [Atribacterota bacterium]